MSLGMIRLLLVLTAMAASSPSVAQPQPLGPAAFCGIPTFAAPNPQGASATVWQGQPVIIIDHSQFQNPAWLQFVVAHECAHHVLGHTLPSGMWFRNTTYWATAAQELQADCWAAGTVHPQASAVASQQFFQQGPFPGPAGYPSGAERSANIRRCAGF